jgi:hypothetical protein
MLPIAILVHAEYMWLLVFTTIEVTNGPGVCFELLGSSDREH